MLAHAWGAVVLNHSSVTLFDAHYGESIIHLVPLFINQELDIFTPLHTGLIAVHSLLNDNNIKYLHLFDVWKEECIKVICSHNASVNSTSKSIW